MAKDIVQATLVIFLALDGSKSTAFKNLSTRRHRGLRNSTLFRVKVYRTLFDRLQDSRCNEQQREPEFAMTTARTMSCHTRSRQRNSYDIKQQEWLISIKSKLFMMPRNTIISALVLVFVSSFLVELVQSFSVIERKHLCGIWKLELEILSALGTKARNDVLIKIQDDGSFLQCNDDDDDDGNWIRGCWEFQDSKLKLALDRKCTPSSRDILLSGNLISGKDGASLTVKNGNIHTGKFMYPPDNNFWRDFDNVMAASESCSTFSLHQTMGFHRMMMPSTSSESLEQEKKVPKFEPNLFFGKKFFMTIVPIEGKTTEAQDLQNAADIRTMPIEFFANHTFQGIGINKILRGRFEITEDDKLWFKVSRFGMGRSQKGSVFSEGVGLSHEDERTYVGTIVPEKAGSVLEVNGKVTFGADLGSDARPEPVGTFIMTEVDDTSLVMEDGNDHEVGGGGTDDIFDSVFE